MATFATLPGDLLTAIASYVDGPQIVVAVAADGDARAAVRRGVDEAERALRGMSVRGAEAFLLHAYRVPAAALSDRHAAGLVLVEKAAGYCVEINQCAGCTRQFFTKSFLSDDAAVLIRSSGRREDSARPRRKILISTQAGYEFESDIIPTLLAYRAVPDVETSSTIDGEVRVAGRALHYVSGSGHERSLLFASLLLDAGADINARCDPGNLAGRTALAWALADDYDLDEEDRPTIYCEDLESVLNRLRVASLLVERGADIEVDRGLLRCALANTEDYVSSVFDLSIQRWDEIEEDVRRAHLSTMPDCTEELSSSYCFIVDRLDASLAAAEAANAASRAAARVAIKAARRAEKRRLAREKELKEAYEEGRKAGYGSGYGACRRHDECFRQLARRKVLEAALGALLVGLGVIAVFTYASRVGWVDCSEKRGCPQIGAAWTLVVLLSWSFFIAKAWWTSKSPPRGPFSQASARIWIEGGARVLFWDCQGLLVIAALCASKVGLLDFAVWDVRLLLWYSWGVGFFSQWQLSKQDGRFNGNGRENGRVILRRALGLIICTPLGALCRCAAYEQLLDVLHIVQATGIKQALFPK